MSPEFCKDYREISTVRATDPARVARLAQARKRGSLMGSDGSGSLLIVAADHPARGALGAGGDALAMNSRVDLLDRLREALKNPAVDGVLGTPDIIEDLMLVGALEGKLVFGSMNRGGLQGATWEIEDRVTAYTAQVIKDFGYDGGKMLTRIDLDDDRTSTTLEICANAVSELAARQLVAMVEPFMSRRINGAVTNDLSPDAVIRSIHIAQGIGATSAYTWLKLPAVDDMERVMEATTLPSLILGGDPVGDRDAVYASWQRALAIEHVRGLVVGRSLLYPADGDVAKAVATAAEMKNL